MTLSAKKRTLFFVSTALSSVVLAPALSAQDQQAIEIEEVLVTATKRSQDITDVPVAIVAFSGDFQRQVNLDDIKDLVRFTPGFAGDSKDSFIDYLNIRGISTNDFGVGGDPSVGIFKNNTFQGRNGVVVSSLFDIDRAEVLRGPQGFLFGRNAIGGAISLHTTRPTFDDVTGYFNGGFGERGIAEMEAGINLPVNDDFALRAAGYYSHEDGYVENRNAQGSDPLIGHEKVAGRISATVRGEGWDFTVIAEAEERNQDGSVYRAITDDEQFGVIQEALFPGFGDVTPRGGPRDIDVDASLPIIDEGRVLSFNTELNVELGFANLVGLFNYRDHTYSYGEAFGGIKARLNHYNQEQDGQYVEGEIRLVSDDSSDSPLSWYAGVSGYHEDIDADFTQTASEEAICYYYYYDSCTNAFPDNGLGDYVADPIGLQERNRVRGDYQGFAAYFDTTYQVTDKLSFSAGIRYSYDQKDFAINILDVESGLGPFFIFGLTTDGPVRATQDWDDFTPRFNATYKVTDDTTLYASITRGYKAGGFASFAVDLGPDGVDDDLVALPGVQPDTFDPETVWSYEVGLKSKALDNRVTFDLIGYYYNYNDLQLAFFDAGGTLVENVGSADGYGLEASARIYLAEGLDIFLTGTWQGTDIADADDLCGVATCDGNRLPGQPEFITSGVLTYSAPVGNGELVSAVEWRGQTATFATIDNFLQYQNPGYFEANFRLGYEHEDDWHITAYMENAFDEVFYDGSLAADGLLPGRLFGPSRPRTFGIRFGARFGE